MKLFNKDIQRKHIIFFSIICTIILILFFSFARATIVGYTTYNKIKNTNYSVEDYGETISDLKTKLNVCEANLSTIKESSDMILVQSENSSKQNTECQRDLEITKTNFSNTQAACKNRIEEMSLDIDSKAGQIEELTTENNVLQSEQDNLKNQYDLLARNTANNLCCKAKVDNPSIKYYKVENNKVICLEEGTLRISC